MNLLNEITIGDRPATENHEWWVNLKEVNDLPPAAIVAAFNSFDLLGLPDEEFATIANKFNSVIKTRIRRGMVQ